MVESQLEIQVNRDWETLVSSGMVAREQKDGCTWILGDLSLEVSKSYGEDTIGKYAYAVGVARKTLMNYRTVASRFTAPVREKYRKLSFTHFQSLVAVETPEAWLEKADDNDWSVETMKKELSKELNTGPNLEDKPPEVYRCPECNQWRMKDVSSMEICRGHYHLDEKGIKYT